MTSELSTDPGPGGTTIALAKVKVTAKTARIEMECMLKNTGIREAELGRSEDVIRLSSER